MIDIKTIKLLRLSFLYNYILFLSFILPNNFVLRQDSTTISNLLKQSTTLEYNDWNKAWNIALQAEEIAINLEQDSLAYVYVKQAYLKYIKGDISEAMALATKAYTFFSEQPLSEELIDCINTIGLIHMTNQSYDTADHYFNLAYDYALELNNTYYMGRALLNLASLETRLGYDENAIALDHKSLDNLEKNSDLVHLGILYNQMGYNYYRIGLLDSAKTLFKKNITHPIKSLWNISYAYQGLSLVELEKKNFQASVELANIGRIYADSLNANRMLQLTSNSQYLATKAIGDYSKALHHLEELNTFTSNFTNQRLIENTKILQAALSESDLAKYQAQSALIDLEKRNYKNLFISLISFVVFLVVIILFYRKNLITTKELNANLNNSNQLIKAKSIELEKLNHEKTKLFSIISHDLRGPFNSIQQILDMLNNGDLEIEQQQELNAILSSQINKTRSMLTELLSWANSQLDGVKIVKKSIKMYDVIQATYEIFKDAYQIKGISLELNLDRLNFYVNGDENQIKIILQNLLSNALKFTPVGGKVVIEKKINNDKLVLRISDNGVGMDANALNSFNNKYLNHTTKGTLNEEGTGLGLMLVRQFAMNNNINLVIDSMINEGTTIELQFSDVIEKNKVLTH